ncbi:MAG TPA: lipid II flippase MurJ [bacterium]|nr:lipid II flippase MurJ [bacterium]
MGTTLASKALGFLRDVLVARYFGASGQVDAFMVAVAIPTLVGGMGFALSTSLIPAFRRVLAAEGYERARALSGTAVVLTLGCSLLLMLLIIAAAPGLVAAFAPGLGAADAALAGTLLRWLAVLVVCVNLFYVLSAIYNAMEHFTIPAVTDLASNVVVLTVLVLLAGAWGIRALAAGMVAGNLLVIAVLTAPVLLRGLLAAARLWSPDVRRLVGLAAPVFAIEVLAQGATLIENYFGTGVGTGVVASLGYAKRLTVMVVALVGTNIARAVFPVLARLVSEDAIPSARDLFTKLGHQYAITFVPLSVLFVFFHEAVVRLVFARGAFDAAATIRTGAAFLYYSAGLALAAFLPILLRTCYAFADARAPLAGTLGQLGGMAVLNVLLAPRLGAAGIALASSLALLLPVIVMARAIRRHLGGLDVRALLRTAALAAAAAAVALAPLLLAARLGIPATPASIVLQSAVYTGAYVAAAFALLPGEMRSLIATLRRGQ